ncbi:MAG: acyl carrier protein [Kofleriaceae bacterium]
MTLAQRIRQHIVSQYLGGGETELDENTPLLELNIIDSTSLFDLVRFLSEEASIRIHRAQVVAANFETIGAMVRLVERTRTAA